MKIETMQREDIVRLLDEEWRRFMACCDAYRQSHGGWTYPAGDERNIVEMNRWLDDGGRELPLAAAMSMAFCEYFEKEGISLT